MGKIILWAIVIIAGLMVWRVLNYTRARARQQAEKDIIARGIAADSMVRCAHCQVYLPRSEAFMSRGQTWCSAEHARAGLKD